MGRLTVPLTQPRRLANRALITGALVLAAGGVFAQPAAPNDAELAQRALRLVNAARAQNDLPALEATGILDAAALAHARDMAERNFYAHESPEGETVRDRFMEAGGSRWKLVAENLARCEGCPTPPGLDRIESFQRGWMDSPGHRANILAKGLEGFGFAIVADEGTTYAVQTFAGPGAPEGLQPGEEQTALPAGDLSHRALKSLNRARADQDAPPLEASTALDRVAAQLIAGGDGDQLIDGSGDLFDRLPEGERRDWSSLNVVAAGCGGCGSTATAADMRRFVQQWLDNPAYQGTLLGGAAGHVGFALDADGEGRKVAVAVVGTRR
jgi:uncharacterized protein YkwD